MIKVKLTCKGDNFISLKVTGHANSATYGHDLVCSAVSAVVTGGFNNLKEIESFKVTLEEGNASLEAVKEVSAHDKIVIETIVSGLKTIAESDPEFVKIIE
jgi:hypothetical protein